MFNILYKLETAHQLFLDKKYREALEVYDEVYKKNKNIRDNLIKEYAICLQERLRYKESINLSLELLDKNNNDTELMLNYVICLGKQGKHQDALREYEKIFEVDKTFKEQIGYYAYLLERNGLFDKADKYYLIALTSEPDNIWYISHYALYLHKAKRYQESQMYFQKALQLEPDNTWAIKRYAFLINDMQGKEVAYSYYQSLIQANPQNSNFLINLAELCIVAGEPSKAITYLNQVQIIKKPLIMEIINHFYLAVYFISQKNYLKLKNVLEQIRNTTKEYSSYIHRDFTDLGEYITNHYNLEQQRKYKELLYILNDGKVI